MSVQIVGVMLDPSGGEPASGAMIEFIALTHYAGVPKGAESVQVTSSSGAYDFPLNYGRYSLKINHSGRAVDQGVAVVVNEESLKVMTIDQLLASQSPLTPPEIAYIRELTERAEAAAASAESSKDAAKTSEGIATGGADTSTQQASIATAKASEAAQSEASALDSKNTVLTSEANVISLEQSAENSASSASADAASIFGVEANVTSLEELARNSATESTLQADRSEAEADRAASASGDVTWKQYASKQVDMEAEREANKNLFAASGWVEYVEDGDGVKINEGLFADPTKTNELNYGGKVHVAGFITNIPARSLIKFPAAPDGRDTYNKSTGEQIRHATPTAAFAAAAASSNVEVVTDRVDMFGGEFFLEPVNATNPYVYPDGRINSTDTSMNGITTVKSNRPESYYGGSDRVGLGVDFFAATDAQKQLMLSDKSNNLFLMNDGVLVQWRMRERTVASGANGNWNNTNPTASLPLLWSDSTAISGVMIQGVSDTVLEQSTSNAYRGKGSGSNFDVQVGIFSADVRSNQNSYFHVWGTVPRLNQGAHHPSHNSMGAKAANNTGTSVAGSLWWGGATLELTSTAVCFNQVDAATNTTTAGAAQATGVIGIRSGRDDDKLYDAIYASGQGGVIDDRLSAYEFTLEDVSQAKAKLKNGSLRGMQKLPFTKIYAGTANGVNDGDWGLYYADGLPAAGYFQVYSFNDDIITWKVGDTISITDNTDKVMSGTIFEDNTNIVKVHIHKVDVGFTYKNSSGNHIGMHLMSAQDVSNTSVEGNADNGFTVNDVIGDPANILLTPDLANGWLGHWIPTLPDEVTAYRNIQHVRKTISTTLEATFTSDNGATWSSGTFNVNTILNSLDSGGAPAANQVRIHNYQSAPYQTEQDINRPVLFGEEDLSSVHATEDYRPSLGGLFGESLLHKVMKHSVGGRRVGDYAVTVGNFIASEGGITTDVNFPLNHEPIDLGAPQNNSPAVKALIYPTSENQQVSLNVGYNELVYGAPVNQVDVTSANAATTTLTAGTLYKILGDGGTSIGGRIVMCISPSGVPLSDKSFHVRNNGTIGYTSNSTTYAVTVDNVDSWGDDSTVRIIDGQGTYKNLNGDTCLYGSNRTTKKLGYTKNRARVGKQTPGVDL